MTSFRQIEANRRNALLSTGPKTDNGKRRTRHNAVRHGLTAETVVVALEDIRDYQAFEAAIIADYDAWTAVERELVLRLASLLWRIRRATAIETDLLQIQAEILHDRRNPLEVTHEAEQKLYGIVYRALRTSIRPDGGSPVVPGDDGQSQSFKNRSDTLRTFSSGKSDIAVRGLTTCFLRLVNLDNGAFERLSRYEKALWRQISQILLLLRPANYR
jgi:hypothetical protein